MNIKLVVLGYELGRIQIDLPAGITSPQEPEKLVEALVDGVSGWWVQRMMKRRSR
jgi:hypothetical protein